MNNSASVIRPHFWTHGDRVDNFLASVWADPSITKFSPIDRSGEKMFDSQRGIPLNKKPEDYGAITYKMGEGFAPENYLSDSIIRWGGGRHGYKSIIVASLRLLYALGFARVYLAGIDWRMEEGRQYGFDEVKNAEAVKVNNQLYAAIGKTLSDARPILEAGGMQVLNTTLDSRLTAFNHLPLIRAVEECQLVNLDGIDPAAERTRGMYK
jgi:hypothetical protein